MDIICIVLDSQRKIRYQTKDSNFITIVFFFCKFPFRGRNFENFPELIDKKTRKFQSLFMRVLKGRDS